MLTNALYIVWAALNVGLFIFILLAFFKITRTIREVYGLVAAIFFVVFLMGFANSKQPKTDSAIQKSEGDWNTTDTAALRLQSTNVSRVVLEKTSLATQHLNVGLGWDAAQNKWVALNAATYTNGFTAGTSWVPLDVIISAESRTTLHYTVVATVQWSLPFMPAYRQSKFYDGSIALPPAPQFSNQ